MRRRPADRPETLTSRRARARRARALRSTPLLRDLPARDLALLDGLATEVAIPIGRTLVRQGSRSLEGAFVLEGRASVERDGRPVATVGPGAVVGVESIAASRPSPVTVRALEPMRLLVLHHADAADLLAASAALSTRVRPQAA